jgi:DNA-binding transcriptional regulator WhiA
MKQLFFWIVVLIGMYLVVANGKAVNSILATLSDTSLKGIVACHPPVGKSGVAHRMRQLMSLAEADGIV